MYVDACIHIFRAERVDSDIECIDDWFSKQGGGEAEGEERGKKERKE